jgi:hypothetical protein
MTMAPQDLFPQLAGWVANLDDIFPGKPIKDSTNAFALIEVGHILSLIVLGGSSILLNLRLLGVGITDETPSEVHRNLGRWMNIGVIGILLTGLLIGSANAERLYTSQAFSAKMVGLLAGVILTYAITLPAAKHDGRVGIVSRLLALVGLSLFVLAIWVFLEAKLSNPGLWHVISAGALVALFATRGITRIVYLAGMAIMIVAQQIMTHVVIRPDDYAGLDPVNKGFAWAFFAWIALAAIAQVIQSRDTESGPYVKAMAWLAMLVWVMTAAAGRWLAFA